MVLTTGLTCVGVFAALDTLVRLHLSKMRVKRLSSFEAARWTIQNTSDCEGNTDGPAGRSTCFPFSSW